MLEFCSVLYGGQINGQIFSILVYWGQFFVNSVGSRILGNSWVNFSQINGQIISLLVNFVVSSEPFLLTLVFWSIFESNLLSNFCQILGQVFQTLLFWSLFGSPLGQRVVLAFWSALGSNLFNTGQSLEFWSVEVNFGQLFCFVLINSGFLGKLWPNQWSRLFNTFQF